MLRRLLQLPVAHADAAAMTAVGVGLTPIHEGVPPVRMQREEVDIWLFVGLAVVEARFELDNLGPALELEVGFPCLPTRGPFIPRASALRGFAVRVDDEQLQTVRRDHDNHEFPSWYVWKQIFPRARTVVVEVRYWVPLSPYRGVSCAPFVYVLRTGRFWRGSIGEAIVRVHPEGVPPEAILASTPGGCVREGTDLVWRFAELDPQHDIGLLVSPLASVAARLGLQPYRDVPSLHEQRPDAGTPVAVGGYFREHAPNFLLGERSRDVNIAIPDGLRAYDERADANEVGVLVRGLERAASTKAEFPREDAVWNRTIILGRVTYEGERLLVEAQRRVDLGRGAFGLQVPKRFAWAAEDRQDEPWTSSVEGAWPPFVERATLDKLDKLDDGGRL